MNKIIFSAALMLAAYANAQNTGIGTTAPNATLEVKGSPDVTTAPDGVIAPRLTLAQLIAKNGYGASQTGAIVYVSDTTATTNATTSNVNSIGYYFFDGTVWQKISGNDWSLTGNSGTTPGNNFIGTTDDQSLIFKVNNNKIGQLPASTSANIGFGRNIFNSLTTGIENTALGNYTLAKNTSGGHNVAVGSGALSSNTIGITNVAVGQNALMANTTANDNIGIGNNALMYNTTGNTNIAIGSQTSYLQKNSNKNIVLGHYAMDGTQNGNSNIAIGNYASYSYNGDNNVVIGNQANYSSSATSGQNNIIIGNSAGSSLPDGSNNNIVIGSNAYLNTLGLVTPYTGYVFLGRTLISDGAGHTAFFGAPTKSGLTVNGNIATSIQDNVSGNLEDYHSTILATGNITLPTPSEDNAGRIIHIIRDTNSAVAVTGVFYKNQFSRQEYVTIENRITLQCYYNAYRDYNGWIIINEQ